MRWMQSPPSLPATRPLNDTGVVVALSDEETLTDAIATTDEEAKDGVLVVLDKTPSTLRWAVRLPTTAC